MRGRNLKKLLDAINLLAQPTGTTISSLCQLLEIDKRQAYRVLETLQYDFKFFIDKDKAVVGGEVRYYLDRDQYRRLSEMKVADLNLSMTEIIALYFLKGHARLYRGTGIEENIERAFAKLDVFVPAGLADRLERVKTLLITANKFVKDYKGKDELIDNLTKAILQQKTCMAEYHSFSGDAIKKFKIDPLKFFEWNNGLYLFVRATKYDDIRVLAAERIINLTLTNDTYDYPDDFEPDSLLEGAFGLVYDDPLTVKIQFSAGQARYIEERCWSKDQIIKKLKDGSIILTMTTSGWFDVRKWLLSFGADAELLEPADKREEMRKAIRELADLYERTKP
ncbi:MAG: helix-turn-helix transcriptional regulator [Syntrophales bacterium]